MIKSLLFFPLVHNFLLFHFKYSFESILTLETEGIQILKINELNYLIYKLRSHKNEPGKDQWLKDLINLLLE